MKIRTIRNSIKGTTDFFISISDKELTESITKEEAADMLYEVFVKTIMQDLEHVWSIKKEKTL